ncbi:Dps family protein [Lacticaseibacillus suibinensis]|uniref:Dps family protein n=1 Tax=Lacticaseibacillus suibinensis TaxID=2486011 RepID=UPI0013DDE841
MNMTIEDQYQAELKQADIDHHKPTAGAMTGHILANLWYLDVKLHQIAWYVKGDSAFAVAAYYQDLIAENRKQIDELGELLLDENQIAPSTVAEFTQYTKIPETGALKYHTASDMVDATAHDYTTANMFIDRAIKLAERENRPAMANFLTNMRGYNNQVIRKLQSFLGKTAWEGLVEEDDDDDDD